MIHKAIKTSHHTCLMLLTENDHVFWTDCLHHLCSLYPGRFIQSVYPRPAQTQRGIFSCSCAIAKWSTCIHLQQSSPSRWSHCHRCCFYACRRCCGTVCVFISVLVCLFSPTGHEAHSPEARVQRHLHLHALVLLQDDALHHDEPVVSGHGHPHQQQPAGSEHCGQDGQSAAAARTHLRE